MDSGRATVRNMRSKCRCSYVLQFTFRRAVCCVLHRPPSQVIHCTVLLIQSVLTKTWPMFQTCSFKQLLTGESKENRVEGRTSFEQFDCTQPLGRRLGMSAMRPHGLDRAKRKRLAGSRQAASPEQKKCPRWGFETKHEVSVR